MYVTPKYLCEKFVKPMDEIEAIIALLKIEHCDVRRFGTEECPRVEYRYPESAIVRISEHLQKTGRSPRIV
jgi:hypothetical protein